MTFLGSNESTMSPSALFAHSVKWEGGLPYGHLSLTSGWIHASNIQANTLSFHASSRHQVTPYVQIISDNNLNIYPLLGQNFQQYKFHVQKNPPLMSPFYIISGGLC